MIRSHSVEGQVSRIDERYLLVYLFMFFIYINNRFFLIKTPLEGKSRLTILYATNQWIIYLVHSMLLNSIKMKRRKNFFLIKIKRIGF
jgi:hypothetical protein